MKLTKRVVSSVLMGFGNIERMNEGILVKRWMKTDESGVDLEEDRGMGR